MAYTVAQAPDSGGLSDVEWQEFFERIRRQVSTPKFNSQSVDPGPDGVPSGTWAVWKNTTSGIVKLWCNDGGVLKSVTLT